MKNNLTKEEMFRAVKEGVKEAILTMTESGDGYTGCIRTEEFIWAIRNGAYDAIYELAPEVIVQK